VQWCESLAIAKAGIEAIGKESSDPFRGVIKSGVVEF
jgi:hypothetical protein